MTSLKHRSTPVVVLNCRRQGGLGIVRSLGRLGVPVWGIDANRFAPPFFSRYQHKGLRWDFDANSDADSVDFLCHAAKQIARKAILIPTTDSGALFVSRNAAKLQEHYLFHAVSPELVRALCSKKEMFFLASQHSIPTAHSVFPTSRQAVVDFTKSSPFPVMIKGIDGKLMEKKAGKRMLIVRTAGELLDYYDRFEDFSNPNIMLQEYIPGGDDTVWMFNGYFNQRSECLIGMTGKKIHQYPIHTGLTSLGVCIRNQEVLDLTQGFMRAIGYQGILDIGFRYDARDRTYKVLDVNPRIGATFRLFVAENGMDSARALYLDLTGQPVESGVAREGRKWVVEDIDLISSARYLLGRKLGLRDLVRSYSGLEECAFFAADDPLPWVMMFANAFGKLLPRVKRENKTQSEAAESNVGHAINASES